MDNSIKWLKIYLNTTDIEIYRLAIEQLNNMPLNIKYIINDLVGRVNLNIIPFEKINPLNIEINDEYLILEKQFKKIFRETGYYVL